MNNRRCSGGPEEDRLSLFAKTRHVPTKGLNSGTGQQPGKHGERNGQKIPSGRKNGRSDDG